MTGTRACLQLWARRFLEADCDLKLYLARTKRAIAEESPSGIGADLRRLLIGQDDAVEAIVPFVQMHQAGLSPEGRPIGVVLLLGPTGTGKTRTVEALAEVLHGSSKNLLKIDCGEFQMEHEVAKLIGAPPGYLGHRETQPLLSQGKLNAVTSEASDISIVLFDEIEKAAPSMTRLLLGILDKATLRLGDNTTVNFERTLIFMTTNIGAKSMQRVAKPDFGFEAMLPPKQTARRLAASKRGNGGGSQEVFPRICQPYRFRGHL